MKVFVALLLCFSAALALPANRTPTSDGDEDWQLVPDGNGVFRLVDVNAPIPEDDPTLRFVAESDVIFRLFTRRNPTGAQILTLGNVGSLVNSNWRAGDRTVFVIHGWNNNGNSPVNINIRNAYMNRGEFNVVTVDWGAGAQTSNYLSARNRVGAVGRVVAQMADMMNAQGQAFSLISITGHSLGGHAAGMAGKQTTRGRIQTIWGMDPAGPLFDINNPAQRLHSTDANYVEVLHTNAGVLGFDVPIGHASFYPNFGRVQAGCGTDVGGSCSHSRVVNFFVESINPVGGRMFMGRLCTGGHLPLLQNQNAASCVSGANNRNMGEPASNARGVFFLTTNANAPFAQG